MHVWNIEQINYFTGQKKSAEKSNKNKKIGWKKSKEILITCLNFGHFRPNLFVPNKLWLVKHLKAVFCVTIQKI